MLQESALSLRVCHFRAVAVVRLRVCVCVRISVGCVGWVSLLGVGWDMQVQESVVCRVLGRLAESLCVCAAWGMQGLCVTAAVAACKLRSLKIE